MWTRILSAVVGLLVVVPVIIWGGAPGIEALAALALVVGLWEYGRMALPENAPLRWSTLLLGSGVFVALLHGGSGWALGAVVGGLLASFALVMAFAREARGSLDLVARVVLGWSWLGLLLPWLVMVRRLEHGLGMLFVLLGAIWLCDSGAYFVGRSIGRHHMSPTWSPKKTWEGTAGGLLVATVGVVVIGRLAGVGLADWKLAVIGFSVGVAGVVGDLAESLVKRAAGVKDSGRIMPGHGGILDRVDSLLFGAPVLFFAVRVLS